MKPVPREIAIDESVWFSRVSRQNSDRNGAGFEVGFALMDGDNLIWIRMAGAEQHAIHYREERSVSANARAGRDYHCREARVHNILVA